MHKGMVVVLELTTYPGTTREILLPMLGEANGLKKGGTGSFHSHPNGLTLDGKISPP